MPAQARSGLRNRDHDGRLYQCLAASRFLEPLGCFPRAHSAELSNRLKLLGAGTRLAALPLVDGQATDTEDLGDVGRGQAEALPVLLQAFGAKAKGLAFFRLFIRLRCTSFALAFC